MNIDNTDQKKRELGKQRRSGQMHLCKCCPDVTPDGIPGLYFYYC